MIQNWIRVVFKSTLYVGIVIAIIIGFFNLHRVSFWAILGFTLAVIIFIVSIMLYEYDR